MIIPNVVSVGIQGPSGPPGLGLTFQAIAITGNYTLTDTSVINKRFTGPLSANAVITCPTGTPYAQQFRNATTGFYDLIADTGSGKTVRIPPNTTRWIYSDGTDVFGTAPKDNVVDLRDFNVKWDGVHDDGAQLVLAMSQLAAYGGGTLMLPPTRDANSIGVCGSALNVPDFTVVKGQGSISTRIRYTGSGSLFNWKTGVTSAQVDGFVSIQDMLILGTSSAKSAIKFTGMYRPLITGVLVNGVTGGPPAFSVGGIEINSDSSLEPSNTACITISNSGVFSVAGKGLSFTGDGGVGGYCNIIGNRINANADWGIYFNQITGGGNHLQSEACVFGNDVEGNNGGLYVNFPSDFSICGSGHFEANGSRPHIRATDGSVGTSVSGLYIHDIGLGGNSGNTNLIDVQPQGSCTNLVVERVSCSNFSAGAFLVSAKNAIAPRIGPNSIGANIVKEFDDVGNGSCSNVIVHGSTFFQVDTMGIKDFATTGGTLPLFVADQAYSVWRITGPLASDANIVVSTDQAGQVRTIINATSGAHNLTLAGGYTIAQGKSAMFVNRGGVLGWLRLTADATF